MNDSRRQATDGTPPLPIVPEQVEVPPAPPQPYATLPQNDGPAQRIDDKNDPDFLDAHTILFKNERLDFPSSTDLNARFGGFLKRRDSDVIVCALRELIGMNQTQPIYQVLHDKLGDFSGARNAAEAKVAILRRKGEGEQALKGKITVIEVAQGSIVDRALKVIYWILDEKIELERFCIDKKEIMKALPRFYNNGQDFEAFDVIRNSKVQVSVAITRGDIIRMNVLGTDHSISITLPGLLDLLKDKSKGKKWQGERETILKRWRASLESKKVGQIRPGAGAEKAVYDLNLVLNTFSMTGEIPPDDQMLVKEIYIRGNQ